MDSNKGIGKSTSTLSPEASEKEVDIEQPIGKFFHTTVTPSNNDKPNASISSNITTNNLKNKRLGKRKIDRADITPPTHKQQSTPITEDTPPLKSQLKDKEKTPQALDLQLISLIRKPSGQTGVHPNAHHSAIDTPKTTLKDLKARLKQLYTSERVEHVSEWISEHSKQNIQKTTKEYYHDNSNVTANLQHAHMLALEQYELFSQIPPLHKLKQDIQNREEASYGHLKKTHKKIDIDIDIDIDSQKRSNTLRKTIGEQRAQRFSLEIQSLQNREMTLKDFSPPQYMPLQQQLATLTAKNKEQIQTNIFVHGPTTGSHTPLSIHEYEQLLADKYPKEHIKKAGFLLNRYTFKTTENDTQQIYLPPVTPALQDAYELILQQHVLFSQIPDAEHFKWLMREYNYDRKDVSDSSGVSKYDDMIYAWALKNIKTEDMTEEKFYQAMEEAIDLVSENIDVNSSGLATIQFFVHNYDAFSQNDSITNIVKEASYHRFYEKKKAALKYAIDHLTHYANFNQIDHENSPPTQAYTKIETLIFNDKLPPPKTPIAPKAASKIIDEILKKYPNDVERSSFIEDQLKRFLLTGNTGDLTDNSIKEIISILSNPSSEMRKTHEHDTMIEILLNICKQSEAYYTEVIEYYHNYYYQNNSPDEPYLYGCLPWGIFDLDEHGGVLTHFPKTNKGLKNCIEKNLSPWVYKQLEKNIPILKYPHLPIYGTTLDCIATCLSGYGSPHSSEFISLAKQSNCLSINPCSQFNYPLAVHVKPGLCAALSIAWLNNQGTTTENDFTESLGYDWNQDPFNNKHSVKEEVMRCASLIYHSTMRNHNKDIATLEPLPGEEYRSNFTNWDHFLESYFIGLGFHQMTESIDNHRKTLPRNIKSVLLPPKDENQIKQQPKKNDIKIYDLTGIYDKNDYKMGHQTATYYHTPSDGSPPHYKFYDPNYGEVSFSTLKDLESFLNNFLPTSYFPPNPIIRTLLYTRTRSDQA